MKNPTLMTILAVVASMLLLTSCTTTSTPTNEEDVCEAVSEALRNGDAEAFASLFLTEESVAAAAAGIESETEKEKGIKAELLEFDIAEIAGGAEQVFAEIAARAEDDGVALADGVYEGIVETKDRFAIRGLTARTVKMKISFDGVGYVLRVDLLITPDACDIYEIRLKAYPKVAVAFTSPEGDPVVVRLGNDLAYEVEFDAAAADEQGAWIQILFDGKNAGMVAGTSLESPYSSDVPSAALTPGEHVLECLIHPVGGSTAHPSGAAKMTIEVE